MQFKHLKKVVAGSLVPPAFTIGHFVPPLLQKIPSNGDLLVWGRQSHPSSPNRQSKVGELLSIDSVATDSGVYGHHLQLSKLLNDRAHNWQSSLHDFVLLAVVKRGNNDTVN